MINYIENEVDSVKEMILGNSKVDEKIFKNISYKKSNILKISTIPQKSVKIETDPNENISFGLSFKEFNKIYFGSIKNLKDNLESFDPNIRRHSIKAWYDNISNIIENWNNDIEEQKLNFTFKEDLDPYLDYLKKR